MATREFISTNNAPAYIPWMAQAVKVGDLVFTGGSIPRDPDTLEIPDTFEGQCEQVFRNLENVLVDAGTSLTYGVHVTVYLSDIAEWETMNDVYLRFIDESKPPARVTIEVAALNNDYGIEAVVIAAVP